jgi:hypothetical protein
MYIRKNGLTRYEYFVYLGNFAHSRDYAIFKLLSISVIDSFGLFGLKKDNWQQCLRAGGRFPLPIQQTLPQSQQSHCLADLPILCRFSQFVGRYKISYVKRTLRCSTVNTDSVKYQVCSFILPIANIHRG